MANKRRTSASDNLHAMLQEQGYTINTANTSRPGGSSSASSGRNTSASDNLHNRLQEQGYTINPEVNRTNTSSGYSGNRTKTNKTSKVDFSKVDRNLVTAVAGYTSKKKWNDNPNYYQYLTQAYKNIIEDADKQGVSYSDQWDQYFGTPDTDDKYASKNSFLEYVKKNYENSGKDTQKTDWTAMFASGIFGDTPYGTTPVIKENTIDYQKILDQLEQNNADRKSLPARQKWQKENAEAQDKYTAMSVKDLEHERDVAQNKADLTADKYMRDNAWVNPDGTRDAGVDLFNLVTRRARTGQDVEADNDVLYYDHNGLPVNYGTLIGQKKAENDIKNINADNHAQSVYKELESTYGRATKDKYDTMLSVLQNEAGVSTLEGFNNPTEAYSKYNNVLNFFDRKLGLRAAGWDSMSAEDRYNLFVSRYNEYRNQLTNKLAEFGYNYDDIRGYTDYMADRDEYYTKLQEAQDYAYDNPVAATVASVFEAPLQIKDAATSIFGETKNPYTYGSNPYNDQHIINSQGYTGGAGQKVYDKALNLFDDETMAWLSQTAYSGVTSSLQSMATMTVASAIFGPDAGGAVGMLILGSQAAASTYHEAAINGASNGQALLYSFAAGINEALFEALSFEKLSSISEIVEKGMNREIISAAFWKAFAMQGLTEGSEEVFTDLANSLADGIINGSLSEYNRNVQQYIRQGYSKEEAEHLASMDYMQQLLESGLGGLFGGLVSGTGKAVSSVARYGARGATAVGDRISSVKQENNAFRTAGQNIVDNGNIDALVNQANEITGNSRQANRARQAANKLASIDTSTEKGRSQAGKQAAKTSKAIIKYNNTTATKAAETSARSIVADELKKAGYSGRTFDSMVGAIYKRTFDGDARLSHSEKNALKSINDVKGIVNAVLQRYTDGEVDTAVKDARIKRVTDNQRVISAAISETTTDKDGNKVTHNGTVINEEGKDLLNDGTEVEVVGIANVEDVVDENGDRTGVKIEYQLSDGTTVSQSEVSLGSVNKAVVYEGVAALGFSKETANRIIKAFDNSHMSGESFLSAMREAYLSGFTGTELSANGMASLLSDTVRNEIETAGKEDAVADYKSKADRAYNAQRAYRSNFGEDGTIKTGGVYKLSEGKEAVNMRKAIDEYTNEQQTQIKVLQKVAEGITHNNIFVFESEIKNGERVYAYDVTDESGKVLFKKGEHADNGFYLDNGDIYIDLNAGYDTGDTVGTMLWTAGHECGHFIKDWNGLAFRKLTKFFQEQIGEKKFNNLVDAKVELGNSRTAAIEEVVCDSLSQMFTDPNAREGMSVLMANEPNIAHKIAEFLNKFADALDKIYSSYPARSEEALLVQRWSEDVKKAYGNLFGESLVTAGDNYSAGLANIRQNGIEYDEKTGTLYAPRFSANYTFANTTDKNLIKKRKTLINNIAEVTGISRDQAEKFVRTEELAALMVKGTMLEFTGSDMETAIKKNSDYPQGTIDLTNICTKRVPLTKLINRLQEALPSDLMTADDYADIRLILMNDGRTVACGLCFVEDRRQKLGEIFEDFTGWYKKALEEGGHLQRKNSEGEIKDVRIAKDLAKRYGVQSGLIYPSLYEDVELDQEIIGSSDKWYEFQKNHPQVAAAFEAFNNARGQSAGRLLLERAEYKREILSWSDATVQKVNDAGGLRIFSFSDFEAIHLVDLLQIIEDCASKGVKIQGYTKQTAFAKLVSKTGIKLNRSFIPHGRTGITELPNGTKVLAIDTTEGMNPNDPDFINEKNNPNVGNNITGINDEQIHLAMQDNFFHYIIPFHTNKSGAANSKLGVQGWRNYKAYQTDRSIIGGMDTIRKLALLTKQYKKTMSDTDAYDRAFKELGVSKKALGEGDSSESGMVNIYTDVLTDSSVVNAKTFVEKYLQVCAARGIEPRFSQFLDCDSKGNYKYVKGYEKFLVDFKLFDNRGNILPQGLVTPVFDQKFIKKIINDELNKTDMQKAAETYPEELFGDIYNYIRAKHGYKDADMESYQKYKAIVDKTAKASNEDAGAGGFESNIQASPSARKDAVAKAAKELNVSDEGTLADNIRKSERIKDKNLLNFLNKQYEDGDVIHTFKTMQIIDGKLYSPMAAFVKDENGKYQLTPNNTLGVWQQAVEDTKNIYFKKDKNGNDVGMYTLNKGTGTIEAAYNPYEHSSNLVLNDQFESAYERDNLVTVECIIPKSEMSSGYKAQYAKDSTGMLDWKKGCVAGKLEGNPRKVYLSRYLMPIRIVSDAEVAQKYKDVLAGTDVAVPFNVVTPGLLAELEKAGVPIDRDGSPGYQYRQKSAEYNKYIKDPEANEDILRLIVSEAAKEAMPNSKVVDESGNLLVVYHGTNETFNKFDISKGRATTDIQGMFFSTSREEASDYGDNVGAYYLNITNPAGEKVARDALARFKGQNEAGIKARKYLEKLGYDGVINSDGEYIAFKPKQAKSADLITYSDKGKPISVASRFDDKKTDVRYELRIRYRDGSIEMLPSLGDITDSRIISFLEKAKKNELEQYSYIPVRRDTPSTLIRSLAAVGIFVDNRPLIMQVKKAQQSMQNNASSKKNKANKKRPHNLSPENVFSIIKSLDHPSYIIEQTNRKSKDGTQLPDNIAVFVNYTKGFFEEEGFAAVEFDPYIEDGNIAKGGDSLFHTVVTVFEPDSVRQDNFADYYEELMSNPDNHEIEIKEDDNPDLLFRATQTSQKNHLLQGDDTTPSPDSQEENSKTSSGEKGNEATERRDARRKNDYSISGNYASLTDERIDYLIEDYGAGSRKNYAQGWVARINPSDFIDLTVSGNNRNRENFDANVTGDFGSKQNEWNYAEQLGKSLRGTPRLSINADTGKVIGHDGRHRMRALEQQGITSVPVVIQFYDNDGRLIKELFDGDDLEPIDAIKLFSQFDNKFDAIVSDAIPANMANRDKLKAAHGQEDAQLRYDKRRKNPLDRSFMSALKVAAQVAEQNAENKPQAEWLHKYQEAIDNVNETRQDLEAARAKVRELKEKASAEKKANGDVTKETAEELIKAQNNVKTYTGRMNARNERMRKLGEAQPVKAVLGDAIKQYNDELEQRLEAKRERQVSRLKDQIAGYKERRVKAVDKHKSVEARQKIHKLLKDFNKRLTNPTENAYIPKSMKGVVADLLNQVEFATPGTNLSKELSAFKVTYDAIANNPEENIYHDKMISDMIAETIKSIGETQFNDLSAAQATQLLNTMKAIDHTIKDAIKVKGIETEQNAFQFAKQMMEETGSIEKPHDNIFSRYINTSLRAQAMFNRLGNHIKDSNWSKLYDMLDAGQLKMTQILMEGERQLADVFADRESLYALSDYKNGLVDVGLRDENGNPVKITRGMALSVYMALLNEDNARHVMYGGYTIPDMKAYYKSSPDAYGTGETRTASQVTAIQEAEKKLADLKHQKQELIHKRVEIREGIKELKRAKDTVNQAKQEAALEEITATIEDYDTRINDATENLEEAVKFVDDYVEDMKLRIEGMMTDYEKHLIQKAKNLLDRWSKNKLNETTLEEYGFEKATVDNYFPIHTDKDFLGASFDTISRDMALENAGFMKSRIHGTNPVMLEDITDVLNRQIKSVAQYSGLMPAIRQFNRIYGKNTANYENSVQNAIRMKFGPSGIKYIDNLMSDMVGARQTSSTIFDKTRGKMAGAVLSVNPRVAMAQAASYPTAAAEIGWKPLLKALAKGGQSGRPISRADVKLIGTYSPLLDYRMKGYSTEEIGAAKAARRFSSKFADKTKWLMGWINAFDGGTVGRLWYAAEYYVQDNFDFEKGSEEYYEQVADVFNKIVEKTQPNYTTLQRPDVLRNPNAIVKQLTMFMTQRLQNFNILYDSCATLKQYTKDAKHGLNGTTLDDVKDARAAVVRAVTSQVVAAFVIVAMKGLSDIMLHSVNAYRDDDKELTAESVIGTLLNNILDTITSSFLGGSEAYGITKSIVTGDKYDAPEITGVQAFSDVLTDIANFAKAVRDGQTDKLPKMVESIAIELSQITGIPMQSIKKILVGAKNWYIDFANHELGTFEAGVQRTNSQNANIAYNAYMDGNTKKYDKFSAMVPDDTMRGRIKYAWENGDIDSEEAVKQLTEIGGKEANDAYWTVDEWEGKADDGEYHKYDKVVEAVRNKDYASTIDEYLENGASAESIKKAITDDWRDEYVNASTHKKLEILEYIKKVFKKLGYTTDNYKDGRMKTNEDGWPKWTKVK